MPFWLKWLKDVAVGAVGPLGPKLGTFEISWLPLILSSFAFVLFCFAAGAAVRSLSSRSFVVVNPSCTLAYEQVLLGPWGLKRGIATSFLPFKLIHLHCRS